MTHRDVSATLFGVTAGILLGVGSIAWAQHAALSASEVTLLPDDLHSAAISDVYNKRTVNRLGVPLRDNSGVRLYPTVKPDVVETAPVQDTTVVPESCTAVKKAVATIKAVYTTVIPVNVGNTAVRQRMDAAFADALKDVCPDIVQASSSSAMAIPVSTGIDNHCGKYPIHTARYKQCVIAGEQGNKYP